MKILAGILISLYLGLTLFGLYQYKAHNRMWGMKLVVWMSGVVLLVGVGMRFESLFLPIFVGLGFCLAYLVGWRLIGGRFTGWKQHLIRGLAFALCLGSLAAMRYCELTDFDHWLMGLGDTSFMEICRFLLYGLPGFFLVGAISFLASAAQEIRKRHREGGPAITMSRRAKLGYGLILLALLPCVNWYIAGAFLYASAERGQTRILAWVLWSWPGSVNAKNTNGFTPLHLAAYRGHGETAKVLIKADANVNATSKYGRTPLHRAGEWGHAEVAKILLKARADINAKDWFGGWTPLYYAASQRRTEMAKLLLKAGAEVNAKDEYGRTPLHLAAFMGHAEVAKILLNAGAEVNAKGKYGETPLHKAAYMGHAEVAKILLNAGAEVNAKDEDGRTPLDETKHREPEIDPKKQAKCAELLRKHGAKTSAELDAEAKQKKAKKE